MSRYSWLNEGPESSPITQGDLDQIETYADRLFAKVGIDVEFTQHFIDRVNDARNQKQISMAELTRLFKQQYKTNGKKIAQLGPGAEAVMKDMQTDVNMPFALVWDKQSQELDLIAKTVMRKKNFGTSNPVVAVEQVVRENKIVKHPTEVGAYLITLNDKEYKIAKHLNNNERHAGEWSIFTKSSSKFTGDEWEWVDTVYSRSYAIDRLKDFVSQNMKEAQSTLKLPNIDVGDEVMVGKFKNRKATVKGFDKDDNNQPVLKTNKGDQKLFKPRISKLMPAKEDKSIAESSSMMSSEQMLAKLSKEMQGTHTGAPDPNSDWSKYVLSHKGFTLKDIQVDKIPTSVKSDGMSQANIEKYKKADTAKFPPVVIGDNGYLLDGNHRLQAYKYQGIKTIKAYIGESTVVTEAFDNPYPINWFQKTQEVWEGSVQLPDGSKLFIDITESDEGYYAIEFAKSDTQGKGATMKATGTGDEFRIFATVQAGVLEWWKSVDEDDVHKITFNASKHADDSKNRYKLYARFAKQWANKIGWVATSREEDGGISFVLMRPAAAKFAKDQDLEVMEEVDVNTQRGRLAYYLKQPEIKKGMAVHLGKLPKYHDGTDELADMVPDRVGVFALHPDAWESTFYSLTNKDFKSITRYKPAIVKISPNSIVGDMAIANKFYRTNDAEEKQTHAEAYRDSIVPYGSDTSHIKMPEIIMPRLIESAGVGIVTKQNATKDSPVGSEYANVKKFFKGKHKQKHLTQVETLEEMFAKQMQLLQDDKLESNRPQLSGYTKWTPLQLAIMEGGHTLEEVDPMIAILQSKLREQFNNELNEGFFSNLVVGTGIALAAFGLNSFDGKDISKPEVAKEIAVVKQAVVQPGDTIYSLARFLEINPNVLYKLNGYDNTTELKAGDKIKVPDLDAKPTTIKKTPTVDAPVAKPKAEVQPMTNTKLEKVLLVVAKKSGLEGDELAAFMAQCAHESNQFRTLVEYGGSLDFRKYDPRYAPKRAKALGNTKRGDGAKYKGRGYIQITGKYNYTVASKGIGIDLVNKPEIAAEPLIAAQIALWYWNKRVAPKVTDFTNTREVTKPINPGFRGLEQRIEYHDNYKKLAMASLSKDSEG